MDKGMHTVGDVFVRFSFTALFQWFSISCGFSVCFWLPRYKKKNPVIVASECFRFPWREKKKGGSIYRGFSVVGFLDKTMFPAIVVSVFWVSLIKKKKKIHILWFQSVLGFLDPPPPPPPPSIVVSGFPDNFFLNCFHLLFRLPWKTERKKFQFIVVSGFPDK